MMAVKWKCNLCLTMNNDEDSVCELCGTERQLGSTQLGSYVARSKSRQRLSEAQVDQPLGEAAVFDFTIESVEEMEPPSNRLAHVRTGTSSKGHGALPLSIDSFGSDHDTESASDDECQMGRAVSSAEPVSGVKRSRTPAGKVRTRTTFERLRAE
jgi:hypothetical protein